jgi:uncharacterized lipoprotein YddW (UPF0748 family)
MKLSLVAATLRSRLLVLAFLFATHQALAQELRGWWVDAFNNGFKTSGQVSQLIADARTAKVNALFVQVRKRGDAYYNSLFEPKAADVSPASFDPLADLLTKARTGGERIQIHAWIVAYNIWNNQTGTPTQLTHPYRTQPSWLTQRTDAVTWDGANYAFDQGHPAVQEHTYNVAMDIVSRYDVDGLHFDYIRYTDRDASTNNQPWGYHPTTLQRFQKLANRTGTPSTTDSAWLQFRRDQVSALVRRVYLNSWKTRKTARISAALIAYTGPPASQTASAWQGRDAYSRVLQDWRGWLREGILDTGIPMVYRDNNVAVRATEYTGWLDWVRQNQYNRSVAMGVGNYLNAIGNSITQIKASRTSLLGFSLMGHVSYSYSGLAVSPGTRTEYLSAVTNDAVAGTYDPSGVPIYLNAATVPTMAWKNTTTVGHLMGRLGDGVGWLDGATVTLHAAPPRTIKSDANGFWGFVDVPTGAPYLLSITAPGFMPTSFFVSIVGGAVQEITSFNLTPQPLAFIEHDWDATTQTAFLRWHSKPLKTYRVESSESLAAGSWVPLANAIASQGAATQWNSATLVPSTRRFFRVIEE